MQKGRKGMQNASKMVPKSEKIHIKINAEKGWKKHWKNIEK